MEDIFEKNGTVAFHFMPVNIVCVTYGSKEEQKSLEGYVKYYRPE
jgi:hypothetical protein